MTKQQREERARELELERRRARLLTVKEYAHLARMNPESVWRRVREGRQTGVHRVAGGIRLEPPDDEDD